MKIFIIHTLGLIKEVLDYADKLEAEGHEVFVPGRDTDQLLDGYGILECNFINGSLWCDEAHLIWDGKSYGSMFDMGTVYALRKPVKIISIRDKKKFSWNKFARKSIGKYLFTEEDYNDKDM